MTTSAVPRHRHRCHPSSIRGAGARGARPLSARAPNRGRPRRRLRTVVRVVACVLAVALVAVGGYAWVSYRNFTSGLTTVDGVPGASGHDRDGSDQNILLVGDDHRPANASPALLAQLSTGQDGGGTNTDTLMLLHLPAHGGTPTVISFPRDSWVDIPNYGKGKLNSAFGIGARNGGGDAGGMRAAHPGRPERDRADRRPLRARVDGGVLRHRQRPGAAAGLPEPGCP